jgi:hypothetical protein
MRTCGSICILILLHMCPHTTKQFGAHGPRVWLVMHATDTCVASCWHCLMSGRMLRARPLCKWQQRRCFVEMCSRIVFSRKSDEEEKEEEETEEQNRFKHVSSVIKRYSEAAPIDTLSNPEEQEKRKDRRARGNGAGERKSEKESGSRWDGSGGGGHEGEALFKSSLLRGGGGKGRGWQTCGVVGGGSGYIYRKP